MKIEITGPAECPKCHDRFHGDEPCYVEQKVPDPVDHPPHYTDHPYRCECGKGIECIDIIEELPYNIGAAIKYIWRAGLKDSAKHQEDLKKAAWHINREQERLFKTVTEKVPEEYLRPRQCTVCDKMYVKGSSTCCEACICDFTAACKKAPT